MKKKKKKGFRVFCLIIAGVFGILLIKQQSIINRLNEDHSSYVDQKEKLQLQNQQLKEKLAEADTNNYGENLARERLKMVKEGEIFFIDKDKSK